jgi:hypothetical protein
MDVKGYGTFVEVDMADILTKLNVDIEANEYVADAYFSHGKLQILIKSKNKREEI